MKLNVQKELILLKEMTISELRQKYAELFDDRTRTWNKAWLVKRIIWRMQAQLEGAISERARARAKELANEADLRLSPPPVNPASKSARNRTVSKTLKQSTGDNRLPPAGTILSRDYKGRSIRVRVLEQGFEWEGEVYRSLSGVAKAVTGSHMNGFRFFEL